MITPGELLMILQKKIKREWKVAFLSAFLLGLLIHMPILLSDIPNHDGLDSLWFSQNMITSGRWFLTVACGISSYYTIPWVIGLLGILFLGIAACGLVELFEVKKEWCIVAISGLLVSFPALASTFAYVYTLDGYMLALLLAVFAVLAVKKLRYGFVAGGVCLAFSMGTYQAYLSFAMILSLFCVAEILLGEEKLSEKLKAAARYLYMGILGVALYYVFLQILLKIQGKELAAYQGINGMGAGFTAEGLLGSIVSMYRDFVSFTLKGNVLYHNSWSALALGLLALGAVIGALGVIRKRKLWKNPFLFVIIVLTFVLLPVVSNIILLISPGVTYHLLMRYQWVLYLMLLLIFAGGAEDAQEKLPAGAVEKPSAGVVEKPQSGAEAETQSGAREKVPVAMKVSRLAQWFCFVGVFGLILFYGVTDNIAYANLEKKYEKTYAYCVRLLDRIEQTDGYYPGIPIAMIGVVGEEQFPKTDLTGAVTDPMIGMNGDWLLYRGDNYRLFIANYLGATLNILPAEAMEEMYYDEAYVEMDSFPGENSIRIIDGILYVKTENVTRE